MTQIYDTVTNYNYYYQPLKPRITFKSLDGATTYFTFDGHGTTKDINVIYMDAERAVGETGQFNVIIEDIANTVNRDHIRNMKVYIEVGKTAASYQMFFIGFADIFTIRRPRSFYQEYLVSGPSTRIQAAELFISRRQASDIQDIDNPNVVPDSKYNINNIFKDSLTKRSWRPLNKVDVQEETGWETDLISDDVTTNYPVINEPLTSIWDFWDRLAQTAGAVWDIDFTGGVENVLLSYHPAMHTNIRLKSGDLKTQTDDGDRTAYIKSNFEIEENSSIDAGTATRLYATTIQDRVVVASSDKATGSNTLNQRFIAQQVIIENDQRRITDFAFVLSKVGEPDSPNSRLNGEMRMDSGNNKPTGQVLAKFSIPLSSIEKTPKTIFVNDVDVKIRFLEGSNKVWLLFKDRSGIKGNVENDPANTIKWHHNNILNTAQALYSATAPADEHVRDDPSHAAWNSVNTGPIYSFSVLSNIRRLHARTNQMAVSRLRMKEALIDAGFISEPRTLSTYLSINLARRSKPRVGIQDVVVTVPNNFVYVPYQWLNFNDGLSDTSYDLQVQRSRIVISALPGDPQIGALDMNISLAGLYNSLIGNCSCG